MSEGPWWLAEWTAAVRRPADAVELDVAAIVMSALGSVHVRRAEDIATQRARLDRLADGAPEGTFEHWHRLLFVIHGFGGDGERYHDARSSFVPDVLDRHAGIPIALSVVAMEVGRRIGVPVQGIGMPGHFLVRAVGAVPAFVDPFNGGEVLDEQGCRQRFATMFGDAQTFQPEFLQPVSSHQILLRMLMNLKSNYARRRDLITLGDVLHMRWFLPGVSLDEGRELVRILGVNGRFRAGNEVLDALFDAHPEASSVLDDERRRLRLRMN